MLRQASAIGSLNRRHPTYRLLRRFRNGEKRRVSIVESLDATLIGMRPYQCLVLLSQENTRMKSLLHQILGITAFILVTWLFGGCHDEFLNTSDQIVGSGEIVTRNVALSSFDGIELEGIGDVHVRQDTVQSIRVEADDNVIDRLLLEVRNGKLVIGIQRGSYSHTTIRIYVTMKSVELLELTGAGSFAAVGPLDGSTLTCRLLGAGSMILTGRTANQIVELEGAGSVHGFGLESTHCSVMLSGTGSAEVNVTQHLKATISGVGSVIYAGNPPEIDPHVSGVGSIHRR